MKAMVRATVLTCFVGIGIFVADVAPAQGQGTTQLSEFLRGVYQNKEFNVKTFGPARWLDDGAAYTTVEASRSGAKEIVRYETTTGKREVLISVADLTPLGAKEPLNVENYEWSEDRNDLLIFTNSQRVWRQNTRGDYWIFDKRTRKLHQLGGDAAPSSLLFATFSPDGKKVAYVRENNVYAEDVASKAITQLTHDGSSKIINGAMDWVYEEELKIENGIRWSPDSKRIAYWHFDTNGVLTFPLVYDVGKPYEVLTQLPYPKYGLYPNIVEVPYPEAGMTNSAVRAGVVAATGGETTWLDVPGDPRNNYIARVDWAGNSDSLILQHLNRLQNTNDFLLADATTGKVHSVYTDHDKAWVRVTDEFKWLHGDKEFLMISEHDGWKHVFAIPRDGKNPRLITTGAFDVIDEVGADPQAEWFYYTASPENATQKFLYRSRIDGAGVPERLTKDASGAHSYEMSPDYHWAFHKYSRMSVPAVTALVRMPEESVVRVLEDNAELQKKINSSLHSTAEFLKVDVGDGVVLDGWMMKPPHFDATKKYPVLVYVYGEVASQTVVDQWDSQGLFHRGLAEEGYLVVSFDNQGTPAPKGRAWRKIVYGSLGVLMSKQQAQAIQVLEKTHPYVDADRVAVWGWSGGGSSTLNLMFRSPELYKVGMSVAAVPDERLYDSIYEERYMGLPSDNWEGYKAGSAINFAEGLRGNLLIVHGSDDDNVHFQGNELLINRLIELGKPFDFMDYPGRTHSISEGPGTRFHLYSLLARYLETHLKPGPVNRP